MSEGVERIARERQRQIEAEGYSPEHDLEHTNGALAYAAACYAAPEPIFHLQVNEGKDRDGAQGGNLSWHEPWPFGWRRPKPWHQQPVPKNETRIRELEKAGALIAAEIDRLLA